MGYVWNHLKAEPRLAISLTAHLHSASPLPSALLKMIFSVVAVASVLSLLPVSRALALNARETECTFVCPDTSTYGNGLSTFAIGDTTISCSYSADYDDSCIYDIVSIHSLRMS